MTSNIDIISAGITTFDIGIQSYITKFSQKCFILSVYCTVLLATLYCCYSVIQVMVVGLFPYLLFPI